MRIIRATCLPFAALMVLAACSTGLPSNGVTAIKGNSTSIGASIDQTGSAQVGYKQQELAMIYSPNTAGPESGAGGDGKQLLDATRGEDVESRAAITVTQGDAGASVLEQRAGLAFESIVGTGFAARTVACSIYVAASDVDGPATDC